MNVGEFMETVLVAAKGNPRRVSNITVTDTTEYKFTTATGTNERKLEPPVRKVAVRAYIASDTSATSPNDPWGWQNIGELLLAPNSDVVLAFNATKDAIPYWYITPCMAALNA
jgi:hypothetical protein